MKKIKTSKRECWNCEWMGSLFDLQKDNKGKKVCPKCKDDLIFKPKK